MNFKKINFQESVWQNNGMISGLSCDFGSHSSEVYDTQKHLSMGICMQATKSGRQHEKVGAFSPSRCLESPTLDSYATEQCLGLPQYEDPVSNSLSCPHLSKKYDPKITLYPSSVNSFSIDVLQHDDPNFQTKNSLKGFAKPYNSCFQFYTSSEGFEKFPYTNLMGNITSTDKLQGDFGGAGQGRSAICFDERQDLRGLSYWNSPAISQLKQFTSSRSSIPSGAVSSGSVLPSKRRIRWTQDLHEHFVECVNQLGGAEKATPKAILNLMESDKLTVFHVKSHLQKYRIAKHMQDPSEGKKEKKTIAADVAQQSMKTGMQIGEALQLQLDVQKRLHEQLEIQRNLQLRIEEQGRQLRMMYDQQQRNNSFMKPHNSIAVPSDIVSATLQDAQVPVADGLGSTHFPSKVS